MDEMGNGKYIYLANIIDLYYAKKSGSFQYLKAINHLLTVTIEYFSTTFPCILNSLLILFCPEVLKTLIFCSDLNKRYS